MKHGGHVVPSLVDLEENPDAIAEAVFEMVLAALPPEVLAAIGPEVLDRLRQNHLARVRDARPRARK